MFLSAKPCIFAQIKELVMEKNERPHFGYIYPRPAVTTDCVIFGFDMTDEILKVLLIERGIEPFKGRYALPGGFIKIEAKTNEYGLVVEETNESLLDCAKRELKEETGFDVQNIYELGTWSTPGRDPRCITITDAYYALVTIQPVQGGDDAADAKWVPLYQVLNTIKNLPDGMRFLAFDHDEIVTAAHVRLQQQLCFEPLAFKLLPKKFSMTMLQRLYESILEKNFDRRNFARKMLDSGILDSFPTESRSINYQLNLEKYEEFKRTGRLSNLIF